MKICVWLIVGEMVGVIYSLYCFFIGLKKEMSFDFDEIVVKCMNVGDVVVESYVWGWNGDCLVD